MARILLSAPHNRPWSVGQYLLKALRDLGHETEVFDYRNAVDLPAELEHHVQAHEPEIHILFNGEKFRPADIEWLKARGIYTILWNHDVHESLPEWLIALARVHDFYFNIARGMIPRYRELGIENCAWLSEGFDPSFFQYESISPEERRAYDTDAVLVGNISNNPSYRIRRDMLAHLHRGGIRIQWWGTRIPHKWRNVTFFFTKVARSWGGEYIWNEKYAKVVACSKIFVAREINPEVEASVSNRIYAALGNGAFYLSWYNPGMEDIFEIDREIVVFRDLDEMVDKARYYLEHEDERLAIVKAGQARVLRDYSWRQRFEEMFQVVRSRSEVTV
ncbi:MAG: glycosyltransferase [Planctomycetota bacterium]